MSVTIGGKKLTRYHKPQWVQLEGRRWGLLVNGVRVATIHLPELVIPRRRVNQRYHWSIKTPSGREAVGSTSGVAHAKKKVLDLWWRVVIGHEEIPNGG